MDKEPKTNDNGGRIICKQVCYRGQVQGVGFRYTARELASDFALNGYVRNLPTGAVELVAEGEAEEVESFLAAIARRMAGYIEHTSVEDGPCRGYKGFQIRF